MTLVESLTLSAMGLTVVMCALAMLAIIILLFSKAMSMQGAKAAAAPAAAAEAPGISDDTCAMILAVICEELTAAPEEINITAIREL